MCLAVPVLIQEIEGSEALVDIGGIRRRISLALTPEARVGHYVLVHTGYAISVLDEHEARESLRLFEEMAASAEIAERGTSDREPAMEKQ